MQRDEDTTGAEDRLRRGSTVVEASRDEQRDPAVGERREKHLVTKAHESPREQEWRLRGVVEETLQPG